MNDEEKKKLLLDYIILAGESTLRGQEMERIRRTLGLPHEEVLELAEKAVLATIDKKKENHP